jgi:hypothetical protein
MLDLFAQSVAQGELILLNLDEHDNNDLKYNHLFDPDIDKIIGVGSIPQEIWRPQALNNREIFENIGMIDRNQDNSSRE